MLSFELLFCDIKINISQHDSVKPKVLGTAVTSNKFFKSARRVNSLSKAKLNDLENLAQN